MINTPIINSFVFGEISRKLTGRTDISQYYQSAELIRNMIVEFYGGAKRTPGTYFCSEVKTSSKATRIIKFIFSDTQAYIIEVGDKYMRFYMNDGQILTGGGATYELVTTYDVSDIFELQFAQKEDVLYITHPDYPQAELTRTAHNAWTITPIDYSTEPNRPALMPSNITATTITPSADTGAGITLTASLAIFDATHVGSIWKIKSGWVKITAVAAGGLKTTATGNVLYSISLATGPGAVTDWAEGSWSGYRGYPKSVTLYENRLVYGYTKSQPQTTWESEIGAYKVFNLGSDPSDPMSFKADTNEVEVINWLYPSNEILIGTVSGVHSLGTGSDTTALTPTTTRIKKRSKDGTSVIMPQQIGNYVYYWQKYNRILREYVYSLQVDGFDTNDVTAFAEHITESGIVDMAYQQYPYNILWCIRADGKLVALTRQIEQKVTGWSSHDTDGFYESVAVIPKDTYDEIWFVVRRTIGGVTKRYIEYMTSPTFEDQEDAFFVHSGLTLDNSKVITAATKANPVVITATSHGFSNGDRVKIRGVVGMTELNYKIFLVANKTNHTFELTDEDGNNINGINYTTYESGGEARKCVNTVTGLSHLEGKSVQVLTDGAPHPNQVVTSGTITLNDYYSQITVGLGYTSTLKTNDLEGFPGQKVSQGKNKRVSSISVNLYESLGFSIGTEKKMDDIIFRTSAMNTDQAPELFTGIKNVEFPSGWGINKQITIQQDQPLPLNVLSVVPTIEVNE